jgi:predicted RNA-binding Zn ribbon-like protein
VASFIVDGLVVPMSVGGHPALDFCNTRAGWDEATPKEYLHTHAHLSVWARVNGLVPPSSMAGLALAAAKDPAAASHVVARAVAFRSALYQVLVGSASIGHWDEVNREVGAAAAASALTPSRPAVWAIPDQSRVDFPLLAVAWSAACLLTSPAASKVRACPGTGCGWLFTDPRGRRRWCSMAWCGNRDKVRRHAQRSREGTPVPAATSAETDFADGDTATSPTSPTSATSRVTSPRTGPGQGRR